jgi:hypothetical protein
MMNSKSNFDAWSDLEFASALKTAQQIGPSALSNDALLRFCRGAYGYFEKRCWKDAEPFFRELWRRVENHRIPGIRTKTEVCQQIGCGLRWAEMIVAGTAKDSNGHKAKGMRTPCELSSHSHKPQNDEDYADVIARYADHTLAPLMARNWGRYQAVCKRLEDFFAQPPAQGEPWK